MTTAAPKLASACADLRSLAVAGTAKNAGKTTALNHLVAHFGLAGERLGLSSVGRDGEAVDQITNRPKPRIKPPVGSLVATSHESALYSQATLEPVATTPFRTALGPVGIYRVVHPGFVEVAGPVKVREAAALLGQLASLGCTKILLDGAADRRAFIASGVDGFVLATGLVLAESPQGVVEETRAVLARLSLPAPRASWTEACRAHQAPGAITDHGFQPWEGPSFMAGLERLGAWLPDSARALYVPGALADGLVEVLLALRRPVDLIVPAGTHVLASRALLERLAARGQACFALQPLRAVAITVNPTAPDGREVESDGLRARLQDAFPELPVIDVCRTEPGLS
ncbi:MAG: hypothetical protein VKS61_05185 [Candidatus Sericytochromatia bacterium]|nr:hypothetical protein [Candidatus Sericytochromatia bacterium]MEB3221452.1 hypothetical protein [Candidatus Sericytochromatia bacterium]